MELLGAGLRGTGKHIQGGKKIIQRNRKILSIDYRFFIFDPFGREPCHSCEGGSFCGFRYLQPLPQRIAAVLLSAWSPASALDVLPHLKPCRHSGSTTFFPGKHDRKTSRQANCPGAFQYFLSVGVINTQSQMKSSSVYSRKCLSHCWASLEVLDSTGGSHPLNHLLCHCLFFYSWSLFLFQ